MKENIPVLLVSVSQVDDGGSGHTNLGLDMSPIPRSLELDKLVVELLPHRDDPIGHLLDFAQPATVSAVEPTYIRGLSSALGSIREGDIPLLIKFWGT